VFVLNAATDFLLLLITARLSGTSPRLGHCAAAACVGGLYAAAAWLPGWAFLTAAPVKCAVGVGLCLIAFGEEEHLARLTLLFFAVSCALAGGVMALSAADTDAVTFLCAALCAWLLLAVFFRTAARHHANGRLFPVRVCVGGRVAELTALQDSGNTLSDGGQPVLVLSPEVLGRLFPPTLAASMTRDALRSPPDLLGPCMERAPSLRPRLLPYHAVGVHSGLLLSVESDWAELGATRYPGLRLALSPTELGQGYAALWGGEIIEKEARYGDASGNTGRGAVSARADGRRRLLYRRQ
ncbi:MAG: sigma-E processing peptidase SpoIIGA, partial [Oscillibacter sp.]|nr:sigma-E processing peptidase SpoIIGA [Oscillibacter sp.]